MYHFLYQASVAISYVFPLILLGMGVLGILTDVEGGKKGPSLKSVTHILEWWNLADLYLT